MKPEKTNPANWHPAMNLNQDMYFASDIDPILAEIASLREAAQAACDDRDLKCEDANGNLERLRAVLERSKLERGK